MPPPASSQSRPAYNCMASSSGSWWVTCRSGVLMCSITYHVLDESPAVGRVTFASGERWNYTDPEKYLQAFNFEEHRDSLLALVYC